MRSSSFVGIASCIVTVSATLLCQCETIDRRQMIHGIEKGCGVIPGSKKTKDPLCPTNCGHNVLQSSKKTNDCGYCQWASLLPLTEDAYNEMLGWCQSASWYDLDESKAKFEGKEKKVWWWQDLEDTTARMHVGNTTVRCYSPELARNIEADHGSYHSGCEHQFLAGIESLLPDGTDKAPEEHQNFNTSNPENLDFVKAETTSFPGLWQFCDKSHGYDIGGKSGSSTHGCGWSRHW